MQAAPAEQSDKDLNIICVRKFVVADQASKSPENLVPTSSRRNLKRFLSLDSLLINWKLTLGMPWRQTRDAFVGGYEALGDCLETPRKQSKLIPRKRALASLVKSFLAHIGVPSMIKKLCGCGQFPRENSFFTETEHYNSGSWE